MSNKVPPIITNFWMSAIQHYCWRLSLP